MTPSVPPPAFDESGEGPQAEELFAEWAARAEAGDELDFTAFLSLHPRHAEELRRLHEDWRIFGPILGRAVPGVGGDDSLPPVRPLSSLASDSGFAATEDLVDRLGIHASNSGRYRFRGVLGRGGGGVVLKVWDSKLSRPLAMKVVLGRDEVRPRGESPRMDGRVLTRFVDEARIASQLNHPGIVPVHELGGDENGRAFFTMKLVKGEDFSIVLQHVKTGHDGWNQTRALGVLLRVCEAMSYAHDKAVVHRDLKPANVMVGKYGEVYVMDWGLARVLGEADRRDLRVKFDPPEHSSAVHTVRGEERVKNPVSPLMTMDGQAVGTVYYMPPEQARGRSDELGFRADVYGVGAMLYQLLAGAAPYETEGRGLTSAGILSLVLDGPPRPLSQLAPKAPAPLVAICEKAMARDVHNRYAGLSTLERDLRAFLEHRVVSAYESGIWAELRAWTRRHRALTLLGTAAALAIGLAIDQGLERATAVQRQEAAERSERQSRVLVAPAKAYYLTQAEHNLWPALPRNISSIVDWLHQVDDLQSTIPDLESYLKTERARQASNAHDPHLQIHNEELDRTVRTLRSGIPGVDWVQQRLQLARSIEAVTSTSTDANQRWTLAQADITTSAIYQKLSLSRQDGLLPLRRDPQSGLWEFWHALSGTEPALDPNTGRWEIREDTGIVLVLIPGGEYVLGSPDVPETDPRFDPYRGYNKSKPLQHHVRLDPYFLSKYEMTQAQWWRATHQDPSQGGIWEQTHPVETISQLEAVRTLARFDLVLPTEAQWEVGARGGAETVYSTGRDPLSMVGSVVLAPSLDPQGKLGPDLSLWGTTWQRRHEIVGGRLPNGYGLHDVHGNVWEWCRDIFSESADPRPGDGLRISKRTSEPIDSPIHDLPGDMLRMPETDNIQGVLRGGGWKSTIFDSRLPHRFPWGLANKDGDAGVRPARPVRP